MKTSFKIYKSSAGSGKTFTLVKSYLTIALSSDNALKFKTILAVTFTKKAANEMKQRILDALEDMAEMEMLSSLNASLKEQLLVELAIDEATLKARASKSLKGILHNYSEFAINTIDSFVHSVIRSFAGELGLSQQFDVSLEVESILERAVEMLLDEVVDNKDLRTFMELFVTNRVDTEKSWKIEDDLVSYGRELLNVHNFNRIEKLRGISLHQFTEIRRNLKSKIAAFEQYQTTNAEAALEMIASNEISHGAFRHGAVPVFFKNIRNGIFTKEPGVRMLDSFRDDKWTSGKCTAVEKEDIESIKDDLTYLFDDIMAFREANMELYVLQSEVLKNLDRVALLSELERIINGLKVTNNLVLISDFNKLVSRVVQKEAVPFIYEKLGERYFHYLFDEFQDTSLLQWHNMLPLVENALAQGGSCMVVGDGKQSIYRWRGGEVDQFVNLPKVYNPGSDKLVEERQVSLINAHQPVQPLGVNYRSKKNIVTFNNILFKKAVADQNDLVQQVFEDVFQEVPEENSGGFIEFSYYNGKVNDSSVELTKDIVQLIYNLLDEGYRKSDIAILSRNKKNTLPIVEALNHENIAVASSESLLVRNSVVVRLAMAFLNWVLQPHEPNFMAEVLVRLSEIYPGRCDMNTAVLQVTDYNLDAETKRSNFLLILTKWGFVVPMEKLLGLPLFEMVSFVLELFGVDQKNDSRLAAWMEFVLEISVNGKYGLNDLVDRWEAKKNSLSIETPEGHDAVNVLTIHKAKGLDWPVVILAEGSWIAKNNKHSFWVDLPESSVPGLPVALLNHSKVLENSSIKNQYLAEDEKNKLDNINLLYVACTRPSERLYTFVIKPTTGSFKPFHTVLETGNLSDDLQITESVSMGPEAAGDECYLRFSYGVSEAPRHLTKTKAAVIEVANIRNSAYRNKINIRQNPLRAGADGQRQWGNLVHEILSGVITHVDIQPTLETFYRAGKLTSTEKVEINTLLQKVLRQPDIEPFFTGNWQVKNEAEILLPDGQILRPDRVLIQENTAVVIDFKTGLQNPKHREQVRHYKDELQAIGYRKVSGYVLYLSLGEMVEV